MVPFIMRERSRSRTPLPRPHPTSRIGCLLRVAAVAATASSPGVDDVDDVERPWYRPRLLAICDGPVPAPSLPAFDKARPLQPLSQWILSHPAFLRVGDYGEM